MSAPPEALLADFARRIHLQDGDVNYLLSLLQSARSLGSEAGAADERSACAVLCDNLQGPGPASSATPADCAAAIRQRRGVIPWPRGAT